MSLSQIRPSYVSAFYLTFIIKSLSEFLLTINTDYYRYYSNWFWFDLLDSILQILWIMIFTHSLLLHFYINHDSLKESLHSFIREDHVDAFSFTILSIGMHLSGNTVSERVSSDSLEEFLEDPANRLLPLNIGVYNENDDDFQLDEDYYRSKYKFIRLRRIHSGRNNHKATSNIQASSSEETIRLQELGSSQISQEAIHGFLVKNIEKIDQNFICQSCHLVLRQPYQLCCGHRQCQSCIDTQHE
jgi:hypothetical protein